MTLIEQYERETGKKAEFCFGWETLFDRDYVAWLESRVECAEKLADACKEIDASNSYWWQEVGVEVAERLKAVLADYEAAKGGEPKKRLGPGDWNTLGDGNEGGGA